MKRLMIGVAAAAVSLGALGTAAPAAADPDTAFTNELNTYGIYGQKDYNAWIGKIACKRITMGTDPDLFAAQRGILDPVFVSDDAQEGARAFAEKRAPKWTGH